MACERYRDALTDVAAGTPATAAVEAHLAACEACREELDALRRALAVADAELAGLVAAEPSPELAVRIRQAVADSEHTPAWRFGWLWPVAAAAATVLVALAVWVERVPSPEADVAVDVAAGQGLSSRGASAASGAEGSAVPSVEAATAPGGGPVAGVSTRPAARTGIRRAGGSLGLGLTEAPRDDEPEVLVPPGGEEALRRFAAFVHRDRRAPGAFLAAGGPSGDLPELAALTIEPLEIVPLDPAETSGT